jgi:hypothetical protein
VIKYLHILSAASALFSTDKARQALVLLLLQQQALRGSSSNSSNSSNGEGRGGAGELALRSAVHSKELLMC